MKKLGTVYKTLHSTTAKQIPQHIYNRHSIMRKVDTSKYLKVSGKNTFLPPTFKYSCTSFVLQRKKIT